MQPDGSSFLNVSDQLSQPYKITGKVIVMYNLILIIWIVNWKTRDSARYDNKHCLTLVCS
jgi:hypothetical protein